MWVSGGSPKRRHFGRSNDIRRQGKNGTPALPYVLRNRKKARGEIDDDSENRSIRGEGLLMSLGVIRKKLANNHETVHFGFFQGGGG